MTLPGGPRTVDAAAVAGLGLIGVLYGSLADVWHAPVIGTALMILGGGLWFRQAWAKRGTLAVLLGYGLLTGVSNLAFGFGIVNVLVTAACLALAWRVWRHFGPEAAKKADDDETKEPLISFVLLLSEPRSLEAAGVAEIVTRAWGGTFEAHASEAEASKGATGAVIGRSPLFILMAPRGVFMLHNHDRPYVEDPEKAAGEVPELRAKRAIERHTAWIAVDLMSSMVESDVRETFYPDIARLIAELSGPDCLAILHPASGRINPWDAELEEKLRGPDPLKDFSAPVHAPVLAVSDDDPRMAAAVAEAKRRWPEFVDAYRRKDGDHFTVKAKVVRGDRSEVIWMDVTGLEPESVQGRLGNDPVDLGGLKLGDPVEVPLEALNDWAIMRGETPVGLFTVKVLQESDAERRGGT